MTASLVTEQDITTGVAEESEQLEDICYIGSTHLLANDFTHIVHLNGLSALSAEMTLARYGDRNLTKAYAFSDVFADTRVGYTFDHIRT